MVVSVYQNNSNIAIAVKSRGVPVCGCTVPACTRRARWLTASMGSWLPTASCCSATMRQVQVLLAHCLSAAANAGLTTTRQCQTPACIFCELGCTTTNSRNFLFCCLKPWHIYVPCMLVHSMACYHCTATCHSNVGSANSYTHWSVDASKAARKTSL